MRILADATASLDEFPTPSCPAKALGPCQRQRLAVAALAGSLPVSVLAAQQPASAVCCHRLSTNGIVSNERGLRLACFGILDRSAQANQRNLCRSGTPRAIRLSAFRVGVIVRRAQAE